jgi:hypothetical protein
LRLPEGELAPLTPKGLFDAATCGVEGSVMCPFHRESSCELPPQLIGADLAALGVALQANSTPGYRAPGIRFVWSILVLDDAEWLDNGGVGGGMLAFLGRTLS